MRVRLVQVILRFPKTSQFQWYLIHGEWWNNGLALHSPAMAIIWTWRADSPRWRPPCPFTEENTGRGAVFSLSWMLGRSGSSSESIEWRFEILCTEEEDMGAFPGTGLMAKDKACCGDKKPRIKPCRKSWHGLRSCMILSLIERGSKLLLRRVHVRLSY